MHEWTNQILKKFPLLQRLRCRHTDHGEGSESLPPFLGLLMAVMEGPVETPVCFLLPRRGDIARVVAVLYGLHRFTAAQRDLTKGYGESHFNPGDLVRVHPGKHVFRY